MEKLDLVEVIVKITREDGKIYALKHEVSIYNEPLSELRKGLPEIMRIGVTQILEDLFKSIEHNETEAENVRNSK